MKEPRFKIGLEIKVKRDQNINTKELLLRKMDVLNVEGEEKEVVYHIGDRIMLTALKLERRIYSNKYLTDEEGNVNLNPAETEEISREGVLTNLAYQNLFGEVGLR